MWNFAEPGSRFRAEPQVFQVVGEKTTNTLCQRALSGTGNMLVRTRHSFGELLLFFI